MGLAATLLVARSTAPGVAMKGAFATGGQHAEVATGDDVAGPDGFNRLAKMGDARMVEAMAVDGGIPVVHGGQLDAAAQAAGGLEHAGAGAPGPAEQINQQLRFHRERGSGW